MQFLVNKVFQFQEEFLAKQENTVVLPNLACFCIPLIIKFIPTLDRNIDFFSNLRYLEKMSAEQTIELNGKAYPMLADGKYDAIILGTGLKECMLAGLLSKKGMKVASLIGALMNRSLSWIEITTTVVIALL